MSCKSGTFSYTLKVIISLEFNFFQELRQKASNFTPYQKDNIGSPYTPTQTFKNLAKVGSIEPKFGFRAPSFIASLSRKIIRKL